jgi:hypothetical protein
MKKSFILLLILLSLLSFSNIIIDFEKTSEVNNDNTGTKFELSGKYVKNGKYSLIIIPNDKAEETKIAYMLKKEDIKKWNKNDLFFINTYIPNNSGITPNSLFLGMAETSEDWKWIGGVFSSNSLKYGWNNIKLDLPKRMKNLEEDKKYTIYISFMNDKNSKKTPLNTHFYLDSISGQKNTKINIKNIDQNTIKELELMKNMNDDELIKFIQKKTFDYFWYETNPENGLIKDRNTENSPASIAAVGFGLTAIPIGIENGWISYEEGYTRTLNTLKSFNEGKIDGMNGFYYHFVDMENGRRALNSEISSIDTAIFIAGALFSGEYFENTEITNISNELYEKINWQWMLNNGSTLSMGYKPEAGFLGARWDSFNEGILASLLAIGSPTYAVDKKMWDEIYRPVNDNYISLIIETLFVYQYPNIWFDFRNIEDKYANYFNNAAVATRFNRIFAILNRFNYKTYDMNIWGLTASDGPGGYKAYGASNNNHDGTVAPYASIASIPFTPEISIQAIKSMINKDYAKYIWGKYGFKSAFNIDEDWFSNEYIGIDQGDILLMIANYESEFVWKYFMKNKYAKNSLKIIGFEEKKSEYAVTPNYKKEFEKLMKAPSQKIAIAKKTNKKIIIDGNIDEYSDSNKYTIDETMNVPAGGVSKVDPKKQVLNSIFYLLWDDENLYFATNVSDEYIVNNLTPEDKSGFYRTDSIEIYLDPEKAGINDKLMKLAIIPFDTQNNVQGTRHEDSNSGAIEETAPEIQLASNKTNTGYTIEVKIPFKYLGITPKVGINLGFSTTIHNSNKKNAAKGEYVRENLLSWTNLPEIWSNKELWGTLELK